MIFKQFEAISKNVKESDREYDEYRLYNAIVKHVMLCS